MFLYIICIKISKQNRQRTKEQAVVKFFDNNNIFNICYLWGENGMHYSSGQIEIEQGDELCVIRIPCTNESILKLVEVFKNRNRFLIKKQVPVNMF